MRRYQVYLNPDSVAILDDFEKYTNISRSKLIREAIDHLASNLTAVFVTTKTPLDKQYILDSLVGFITPKTTKLTNYATKEDNLYLND